MVKIIGLSLLLFGIIISFAVIDDLTPFWFPNTEKKIEVLWQQDMESLIRHNKLPKEWLQISSVKAEGLSSSAINLIHNIKIPIVTKIEGKYRLEITVDSWTEAESQIVVIEYHLINIATNNLIWEFGRTLETESK